MKKIVLCFFTIIFLINVGVAQERREPKVQVWIPENLYSVPGSYYISYNAGYITTTSTGYYGWEIYSDGGDFDVSRINFRIGNLTTNPGILYGGSTYYFMLTFGVPSDAQWGGSCVFHLKLTYGLYNPQEIFEGWYTLYACYPESISTSSVSHNSNREYIAQDYVLFTDGFRYTTNSSNYSLVSYLEDCDYDEEIERGSKSLTISNNEADHNLKHSKLVDDNVSIYPNPSESGLFFVNGNNKPIELEVLNSSGQIIMHKSGVVCNNYLIDIGKEPSGIYLIRISTDGKTSMQKIIKSN